MEQALLWRIEATCAAEICAVEEGGLTVDADFVDEVEAEEAAEDEVINAEGDFLDHLNAVEDIKDLLDLKEAADIKDPLAHLNEVEDIKDLVDLKEAEDIRDLLARLNEVEDIKSTTANGTKREPPPQRLPIETTDGLHFHRNNLLLVAIRQVERKTGANMPHRHRQLHFPLHPQAQMRMLLHTMQLTAMPGQRLTRHMLQRLLHTDILLRMHSLFQLVHMLTQLSMDSQLSQLSQLYHKTNSSRI